MATISREDISPLHTVITIELAKADYESKVNNKLKDYRKQANFKGFRPGKVPMSLVKQRFGTNVLAEEVNEVIHKELMDYLKDTKVDFLGQPLPYEGKQVVIDINDMKDYEFKYELGLIPEFEVKGLTKRSKVTKYEITIDESKINEEIEKLRGTHGTFDNPETIEESDMVKVDLKEVDGTFVKEDVYISVDLIKTKTLKKKVLAAKVGDDLAINVFQLEDKSEEDIKRYILGIKEDEEIELNKNFNMTLKEVRRRVPAEMNDEFFQKVFGPDTDVKDEAGLIERYKEEYTKVYKENSAVQMSNEMYELLVSKNEFDLPVEFLKRWLTSSNENINDDQMEAEFPAFAKGLRWSIIRKKLAEDNKMEVTQEELTQDARQSVMNYFGGGMSMGDEFIDNMVQRIMEDRDAMNKRAEALLDKKVLDWASQQVKTEPKEVSVEEFNEINKKSTEKLQEA